MPLFKSVDLTSPGPIGSTTPNTGRFTTLTLAPSANTTPFTASGYSLTGTNAQSFFDLSGTLNTTGNPTLIKGNWTLTAAGNNTLLIDLQTDGTSRFKVDRFGSLTVDSFYGASSTQTWFFVGSNQCSIRSSNYFGFSNSATNASGTQDVQLFRDAASVLALRTGTTAQTFRLYNTFTDASNYERGFMRWATNVLEIGAEAAGTGTSRNVSIVQGGATRLTIGSTIDATVSITCSQYIYSFIGLGGRSLSADPTTSNLASGFYNVFKNTTTGIVKLWYNDGGTMKSVALV